MSYQQLMHLLHRPTENHSQSNITLAEGIPGSFLPCDSTLNKSLLFNKYMRQKYILQKIKKCYYSTSYCCVSPLMFPLINSLAWQKILAKTFILKIFFIFSFLRDWIYHKNKLYVVRNVLFLYLFKPSQNNNRLFVNIYIYIYANKVGFSSLLLSYLRRETPSDYKNSEKNPNNPLKP